MSTTAAGIHVERATGERIYLSDFGLATSPQFDLVSHWTQPPRRRESSSPNRQIDTHAR
jgi:hypothetical protein